MRNKRLQGLVTAGRWTLPAAIFICTLCWVLTSVLLPELTMTAGEEGGSVLWQSARTLLLPAWAEHLVSFLIYAAIGYFLIELNNRFSIIRMRASVQTAIYFLLVTVCPEMHLLYAGNVAAITFLFSIYFLFKSYQQAQASGYLFYSFLFIGAGSILFPQLTFFSVLWLFEAHRFQSLTFRSFCGALIGWTMPYWMLFGHAFSMIRWSCSIILSKSWPLLGTYSTYRYSSRGNWRLSVICLYCSSSAPLIASLPDSKIRYARAPIYSFS